MTSPQAASRSLIDPRVSVTAVRGPSTGSASVHACGINRRVPSGRTTSNSTPPWRRNRPRTGSTRPANTSRCLVTVTSVTPITVGSLTRGR